MKSNNLKRCNFYDKLNALMSTFIKTISFISVNWLVLHLGRENLLLVCCFKLSHLTWGREREKFSQFSENSFLFSENNFSRKTFRLEIREQKILFTRLVPGNVFTKSSGSQPVVCVPLVVHRDASFFEKG